MLEMRYEIIFLSHPKCLNATLQGDISPALIMKRVRDASGSKYSVHNEPAKRFEPIAPVGTNYTPVGKVDITALRKGASKDVINPKVVR